jgi:hypothetical protein
MTLQSMFQDIIEMTWRPSFTKARHPTKNRMKSWKAYGPTDRHNPVFEVGINRGNIFTRFEPCVEATKYHSGGIGSVWQLDLEAVDKLVLMLLTARVELLKQHRERKGND